MSAWLLELKPCQCFRFTTHQLCDFLVIFLWFSLSSNGKWEYNTSISWKGLLENRRKQTSSTAPTAQWLPRIPARVSQKPKVRCSLRCTMFLKNDHTWKEEGLGRRRSRAAVQAQQNLPSPALSYSKPTWLHLQSLRHSAKDTGGAGREEGRGSSSVGLRPTWRSRPHCRPPNSKSSPTGPLAQHMCTSPPPPCAFIHGDSRSVHPSLLHVLPRPLPFTRVHNEQSGRLVLNLSWPVTAAHRRHGRRWRMLRGGT